jgi:hypothetical protein
MSCTPGAPRLGTIEHLVDVEGVIPILVLDEAQHLPDSFFLDLAGFLNRNFDRRELLTVWLVGLPSLATRMGMRQHAALASRVVSTNVMPPRGREDFMALVEHGLTVVDTKTKLLSEQAIEILWSVMGCRAKLAGCCGPASCSRTSETRASSTTGSCSMRVRSCSSAGRPSRRVTPRPCCLVVIAGQHLANNAGRYTEPSPP